MRLPASLRARLRKATSFAPSQRSSPSFPVPHDSLREAPNCLTEYAAGPALFHEVRHGGFSKNSLGVRRYVVQPLVQRAQVLPMRLHPQRTAINPRELLNAVDDLEDRNAVRWSSEDKTARPTW